MDDIVTRYLDTWNATEPGTRTDLLKQHWSAECLYVDPLAEAQGHEEMAATMDAVHAQFPGFVFTPVGAADAHHRQVRFQWGLGPSGSDPVVIGFDVVVLDDQERIHQVRGFLDVVPG